MIMQNTFSTTDDKILRAIISQHFTNDAARFNLIMSITRNETMSRACSLPVFSHTLFTESFNGFFPIPKILFTESFNVSFPSPKGSKCNVDHQWYQKRTVSPCPALPHQRRMSAVAAVVRGLGTRTYRCRSGVASSHPPWPALRTTASRAPTQQP